MDHNSKAQNDHNVYILGAGFSREAGYPLIKDFMNRMRDAAAWLQDQVGRTEELAAIEKVLDFRLKAASASYRVPLNVENVEELFSLASASGDKSLSQAMRLAIAATLDYASSTANLGSDLHFSVGALESLRLGTPQSWGPISGTLGSALQNEQPKRDWRECSPYDFYLGLMCGYFHKRGPDCQNTIITLNYDLVIEESLRHLGIDFHYGIKGRRIVRIDENKYEQIPISEASLKLLKLHGSINWCSPAAVSDEISETSELSNRDFQRIVARLVELSEQIAVFDSYRELSSHPSRPTPHLVPPTWSKSLEAPLTSVLNAAVSALRTATRIVILGYSLPPTDQHFRYLLAAGLQDNISLRNIFFVNPSLEKPEIRRSFEERLFGPMGLFRKEHEDQGVVELVPHSLRTFLSGETGSDTAHYRVDIGRTLNPPALQYSNNAPWRVLPNFGGGVLLV
jgi:hypothetical protein